MRTEVAHDVEKYNLDYAGKFVPSYRGQLKEIYRLEYLLLISPKPVMVLKPYRFYNENNIGQ